MLTTDKTKKIIKDLIVAFSQVCKILNPMRLTTYFLLQKVGSYKI